MTIVVAVEGPDGVYVGADSFLGTAATRIEYDRPKWFHWGPALVAYAGDIKIPHIAADTPWRMRTRPGAAPDAVPRRIAERLRRMHRAARVAFGATDYLIAYDGRAYLVQDDASVVRSQYGYCAIGIGSELALGSLATSRGHPLGRVRRALRAVAQHCTQVAPPFDEVFMACRPEPRVPHRPASLPPVDTMTRARPPVATRTEGVLSVHPHGSTPPPQPSGSLPAA